MASNAARTTDEEAAFDTARGLSTCVALLSRAMGRVLAPWQMTWAQAMSLCLLAAQDQPVNATRLVEQLGLGRTAMTAVVDRLERRGWVQRRPHARDRRISLLELTAEGRSVAGDVQAAINAVLEDLMGSADLPPAFDTVTTQLAERLM